jgi:histidine triad (HIT) family protein
VSESCLFCKIVAGELPSQRVAESQNCVSIEDKFPQAPVHCLVIPRRHVASLDDLGDADQSLLGEMLLLCKKVAAVKGIAAKGYRVLTNIGSDGGQAVFHLHFHVLGGKKLGAKLVSGPS